jgi:hypothetical protein
MRHFGPNHATDFFTTTDFVRNADALSDGFWSGRQKPGERGATC